AREVRPQRGRVVAALPERAGRIDEQGPRSGTLTGVEEAVERRDVLGRVSIPGPRAVDGHHVGPRGADRRPARGAFVLGVEAVASAVDVRAVGGDRLEVSAALTDGRAEHLEAVAVVADQRMLGTAEPDPIADLQNGLLVPGAPAGPAGEQHLPGVEVVVRRGQRGRLVGDPAAGAVEEAGRVHAVVALGGADAD